MRFAVALSVVLFAACSNSSASGLPPASDWGTGDPGVGIAPPPPQGMPQNKGHGGRDPHEGVEGAPPITDDQQQEMPNDQNHAFAQQGDQPQGAEPNPHNQNAPVDPNKRIKGVLKLSSKVTAKLKADGAVFIIVKKPDAAGQPTGSALAVDRVTWKEGGQVPFELGFEDVSGEVLVMVRYDQDQDASTKQPGDVTGMVKLKIPADNAVIELDTVLP